MWKEHFRRIFLGRHLVRTTFHGRFWDNVFRDLVVCLRTCLTSVCPKLWFLPASRGPLSFWCLNSGEKYELLFTSGPSIHEVFWTAGFVQHQGLTWHLCGPPAVGLQAYMPSLQYKREDLVNWCPANNCASMWQKQEMVVDFRRRAHTPPVWTGTQSLPFPPKSNVFALYIFHLVWASLSFSVLIKARYCLQHNGLRAPSI